LAASAIRGYSYGLDTTINPTGGYGMKTATFQGWKNCVEVASGKARLVVTAEVGPRIIGIFAGDSPNLAYVNPETAGRKGGDEWRIYGGHRLWHAPEAKPRSYAPDNTAVTVRETRDGIVFCGGTEAATGIHKSFAIKALPKMGFRLTHRLRNETPWDVELAAWALTVMAPGGVAVVPQPKGDKTALLPNRYLTVWPYTDMADARLTWGRDFILLRQDAKAKGPCKFGLNGEGGWLAYANQGAALVKHYEHLVDGVPGQRLQHRVLHQSGHARDRDPQPALPARPRRGDRPC